jgi:peptide/nickel transport system substrate-binding protein
MRKSLATLAPLLAVLALTVAACGGGDDNGGANKQSGGTSASGTQGKKGGTLSIMAIGDVDSMDPGYWYYQVDYQWLWQPGQRSLYGWKPNDTTPSPDLATGAPQVADDGKTITVNIRSDVKYSPPLQTRTVKAADVKYAMERAFLPQVANGYSSIYWSAIDGVKAFQDGKAKEISGIQAPNDTTLVIKTTRPVGVLATGVALAMPATAPVPKDYAQKYDTGKASTYGEHQVWTGPYMVPNDAQGKMTGWKAGKSITLVRNPSWDPKTDWRPAYLDKIDILQGNDVTVASRKVLTGQSMIQGDFGAPPTAILKSGLATRKDQFTFDPSGGMRFIGLNTTIKPLDNINVRKAISAVINRNDLRTTRGGPLLGPIATHFLIPGMPGFEAAGGLKGPPGLDWNSNPKGNLQLAMEYMKKAGYPSGKYSGPPLLMVGDNEPPASKTGEAIQAQLETLGFKLNYRQVQHQTMYSKFCQVPKAKVAICPNVGWIKDFGDGQAMLDPLFNGKGIIPAGNVNYPQVNDPELNALMDKAEETTDPDKRAAEWAEIDKKVTAGAYNIPWIWDDNINFHSTNVNAVVSKSNAAYDLSFTSLK